MYWYIQKSISNHQLSLIFYLLFLPTNLHSSVTFRASLVGSQAWEMVFGSAASSSRDSLLGEHNLNIMFWKSSTRKRVISLTRLMITNINPSFYLYLLLYAPWSILRHKAVLEGLRSIWPSKPNSINRIYFDCRKIWCNFQKIFNLYDAFKCISTGMQL